MPDSSYMVIECLEYDIVVPFICHKCGNCCRKYYPEIDPELLPEIERIINKPIDVIQAQLSDDCKAHNSGIPTDCCFLDPISNECLIYTIRPDSCRSYPSLTQSGSGDDDCPGQKEYKNVVEKFVKYEKFAEVFKPTCSKKVRSIPNREWQNILRKLEKTKASEIFIQNFFMMNRMSVRNSVMEKK